MHHNIHETTLALGAVFESCYLVNQIALHGRCDDHDAAAMIDSIFVTDPQHIQDIYPNTAVLRNGMEQMRDYFSQRRHKETLFVPRYTMHLCLLQRKLMRNSAMLTHLKQGINHAQRNRDCLSDDHQSMIAALANVYTNTISTMRSRIQIHGQGDQLNNKHNLNHIRALLLAGMRAAVLWQQKGGRLWHFLLRRKVYLKDCQTFLHHTSL